MIKHRAAVAAFLDTMTPVENFAHDYAVLQEQQAAEKARRWRDRLTPLDDRLRKILDEIPDHIKAEGLRLPALIPQLAGRTRQHPSAGDVGKALRRLGYRRKRDWTNGAEGYPAVWLPPHDQR